MQHSLFKYYSERKWAESFLDGKILFRSLSYFRDYEEQAVRGDKYEGTSKYRPKNGLVVNNLTQGSTFTLANHSFESSANAKEIFVFCVSRSLTAKMADEFHAAACVEIQQIKTFCERIESALPPNATFFGQRVEYYDESEGDDPRWALPEKIATSKLRGFAWQEEYRFAFCLTDALDFEKVKVSLVHDDHEKLRTANDHSEYLLDVRSLGDICRVHERAAIIKGDMSAARGLPTPSVLSQTLRSKC